MAPAEVTLAILKGDFDPHKKSHAESIHARIKFQWRALSSLKINHFKERHYHLSH